MLAEAKKCLEIWQRLVHISGGELKLTKSSYGLMAWKLKEGTEVLAKVKEAPGNLSLTSRKYKGLQVELARNKLSKS